MARPRRGIRGSFIVLAETGSNPSDTALADYLGRPVLLGLPGGSRFRTITAAIADGPDHRLTLSSNLGEPVALNTKIHFLTLVRSDADRVEIRYGPVASEVTLPVVEVAG